MTAQSVLDVIRRVEETPLQDLVAVDITDVEVQLDHLLGREITADSLYRRWETQQWAVSDLDFTRDRTDWAALPEGLQLAFRRTMTLFFIGEQAVTDTLSPVLFAAPREDERIFLSTQIADEARHTVFFQRFFADVLGLEGGLSGALEAVRPKTVAGFRKIFDGHLAEAVDLVRREPENEAAWVEAVVTYHLVIEGYLALGGQRNLLRFFRAVGLMPGFTAGFTAVARDESRHIGFGVLALRRGDISGAEREIRAAIERKPDVRLAHFNLALLAEQRGDAPRAVAEYQKEIELHANSYKAAFNLGKLFERAGDRRSQLAQYRRAIEMNPSFAEGHLFLAKALLDAGEQLDDAVVLARKGIALDPRGEYAPLGHYVIADVFSRRGRRPEADAEAARGRALERAKPKQ